MQIHKGTLEDISVIKKIADANKDTLGFVTRPALQFSIEKGWLLVAEYEGLLIGFVNYRHRRDSQTTIYEICVAQSNRSQGIGRQLLDTVIAEARKQEKTFIQLKAVQGIPANNFYFHCGFRRYDTKPGKKRNLIVWRYHLI